MAKEKKLFVGVLANYTAELKLLLITLLVLCSIATLIQFIPSRFTFSASDLRVCISRVSQPQGPPPPPPSSSGESLESTQLSRLLSIPPSSPPPSPSPTQPASDDGIIKRDFNPYGSAAYNFITMGAYRGGLNTFAIVGLSSKPLHVYSKPTYECEWTPRVNTTAKPITTVGYKMLPDWGYGHVYTVVILNCTFSEPVNVDNSGGKLVLYASTSGGGDTKFNLTDRMEVLTESPGGLDVSIFTSPPKYDYFYCGSSLYGNLNPQRVREWIAYHVRLFGPRSHFVIHDAGGVHEQVLEVLKPWMELGYVTLQDIRDQERFDGYYHNQFMVVNDCLHRYKFVAKWMFFFDVDEFIYVPPKSTIKTALDSLSEYSQFTFEQMPMSSKICLSEDYGKTYRKWGFEKLVYKDVKRGIRRDRKYAVQPRNVYATGVHMSQNLMGKTTHKTEGRIKYYHYHGTIAARRETCKMLVNSTDLYHEKIPYVLDTTMRDIAGVIKKFELKMIGSRLQNVHQ
ncbi:galactan beta-1,4-galactosyltransferase GALS3 [Neltuma alba]|uniref:galactan beta-1,4-galactosyltransferase GALS3-like n=1 Tax=Neltuma alba TaxID=207710 RepID=UPI0010A2CCF0|nr:galactan beta-1,4-galactosyltransferase GALS3-like [Prosopis alba]XP_028800409.1 galactan beta-1,4-galactosyltransferase GALS3-like [Prosopis alba]